jgi:hypothetical protein
MPITASPETWPKERMIEAIQAWAEIHGTPPRINDWFYADPPYWPSGFTVADKFGNWGNAIEAAGFSRPKRGRRNSHAQPADLVQLARQAEVPVDLVLERAGSNNGWFYVQQAKRALEAAPESPLRDLMYAILTRRRIGVPVAPAIVERG